MKFIETKIDGLWMIDAEPFTDERGLFRRSYCADEYRSHGIDPMVVQGNFSHNNLKGTLRGFHFQVGDAQEAKTISCVTGSIFDIVVDLRPSSRSFMEWEAIELSADSLRSIHLPKGCANAFLTTTDDTIVHYYMSTLFSPGSYVGFYYNDPQFQFSWPSEPVVISEKDKKLSNFSVSMLEKLPILICEEN